CPGTVLAKNFLIHFVDLFKEFFRLNVVFLCQGEHGQVAKWCGACRISRTIEFLRESQLALVGFTSLGVVEAPRIDIAKLADSLREASVLRCDLLRDRKGVFRRCLRFIEMLSLRGFNAGLHGIVKLRVKIRRRYASAPACV